jgi:hypothetical protein
MTISEEVARNIIRKLLLGEDYRIEVITLINTEFLNFTVSFFKKVVDAKFNNQELTVDWYKKEFLSDDLNKDEIAINSGLNRKTIKNMYNTERRSVVIEASNEHYDNLYEAINKLVDDEKDFNLTLTIKFKTVSVELTVSESLIVINTLAVKRAALRGGLWSTAGKRVEKPLMQTLCHLFEVPKENYKLVLKKNKDAELPTFEREIDFYLVRGANNYKCEVKLMGIGNPESADAVIARASEIFVADKLSDTNKNQLNSLGVNWVELRSENGYKKFQQVLDNLTIPYNSNGDYNEDKLNTILNTIFTNAS